MSSEGDKAAVLSAIKVRTKLRGDNSWMQRRNTPETKTTPEKPWIAEVKARGPNGALAETGAVTSPTGSTPPPAKSDTERAPTSGFLNRGVFTKLDKPTTPSSSSNGSSGATQFTKKASDGYKKIAPHIVRSAPESQEDLLSEEEQEKRREAASSVLKKSSVRQRSYVLSAAKKFESRQDAANTTFVQSSEPFVAKRVMINDDDESPTTPAPCGTPPPSTVIPVESATAAPQPKPRTIVDTRVKTAVGLFDQLQALREEEKAAQGPMKEDPAPPPVSVTEADPFEHMKPGCTKVATPLPELILDNVQTVRTEPEPGNSRQADTPLVDLTSTPHPTGKTGPEPEPVPYAPVSDVTDITVNTDPEPEPVPYAPVSDVTDITVNTEPEPSPAPYALVSDVTDITVKPEPEPVPYTLVSDVTDITVKPEPEPVPYAPVSDVRDITVNTEPEPEPSPKPGLYTLAALSDSLISFDTSSHSLKDDEPEVAKEGGGSADSRTTDNGFETNNFFIHVTAGAEQEPVPEISNCEPTTDDLLSLTESPEAPAEPVPPSPGRWSQDLLGSLNSESDPDWTSGTLDFMANDVITINTEPCSFSTQQEEEKLTGETDKAMQSSTETVTLTTKTVIVTDKSEQDDADPWSSPVTTTDTESSPADLFDPYPIGTTSPHSSSDLLQPYSDISINSPLATSTENKEPSPTTTLGAHRWALAWDTSTPQQASPEESQGGDQTMLVVFERKSTENDSPWDRWTSPTVCTVATEEEEDQEAAEESPEDVQTQTITTVTTIRETQGQPQSTTDRYETYSRSVMEDQRVKTPAPEAKKAFVFVKEYINSTELALENTTDAKYGESDGLTSSSASYSYSSPSTYLSGSPSSICTYCGELVGNDAKISIAHLNINSHPACFKCAVCGKPMGDFLDRMFLHGGKINCETCYSNAFE